jgi:hypothetical protein
MVAIAKIPEKTACAKISHFGPLRRERLCGGLPMTYVSTDLCFCVGVAIPVPTKAA